MTSDTPNVEDAAAETVVGVGAEPEKIQDEEEPLSIFDRIWNLIPYLGHGI